MRFRYSIEDRITDLIMDSGGSVNQATVKAIVGYIEEREAYIKERVVDNISYVFEDVLINSKDNDKKELEVKRSGMFSFLSKEKKDGKA